MHRLASLLALLLAAPWVAAQSVTVETVVPAGSPINDALALGPDGALYGSNFGSFQPFAPGTAVTRVDVGDGSTSEYASGFSFTNGLAFGPGGDLFVASYYDFAQRRGRLSAVASDGTVRLYARADTLTSLSGVAYDAANDDLYVTSYDGNWIKRVTSDGAFVDVVAGDSLDGPAGLAFDDQNRLHVANFNDGEIYRVDGGDLALVAEVGTPVGFLAYGGGRFFATGVDSTSSVVYAVTPDGDVSVLAGTGALDTIDGPGETAAFNRPNGIVATASGDTLYVSEAGSGAVRRIVIGGATDAEAAPRPTGALLPIAPNPVAASTAVRFRLGAAGHADVAIYDALGRRVRVLASGPHAAGPHRLEIDASGLAPGAYVVTLRHDGGTESRPFVRR